MASGLTRRIGKVLLTTSIPTVEAALKTEMGARVKAAVQVVRTHTVTTLSGSRSGRQYAIPGTRRTRTRPHAKRYTASAPGEAPAVRLGDLRRTITTRVHLTDDQATGAVGSPMEKSVYLEKGTKQMAARPFLEPSFEAARPEVKAILTRRMVI